MLSGIKVTARYGEKMSESDVNDRLRRSETYFLRVGSVDNH
jgi:hypothetical protein